MTRAWAASIKRSPKSLASALWSSSLMALAGFGEARFDLSEHLSAKGVEPCSVHERGLRERLAPLRRSYEDEIKQPHKDMAASIQSALEAFALNLVSDVTGLARWMPLSSLGASPWMPHEPRAQAGP